MANLYYANDKGATIIENGVVYDRVGQIQGQANDLEPDITGISGFTYNVADAQGMTVYTPAQIAVSIYVYGSSRVLRNYYQGSWSLMITAPVAGVFRIWGQDTLVWRINGISQGSLGSTKSEANSVPINLAQGDVVEATGSAGTGGRYGYFSFLPFVYP